MSGEIRALLDAVKDRRLGQDRDADLQLLAGAEQELTELEAGQTWDGVLPHLEPTIVRRVRYVKLPPPEDD